jgi:glyoxylase-like metal-dependent hydrolase (beta-lactamase superfamily II)
MLIKTFVVGQVSTNCYIVTDEKTLKCAVIDPGDESGTILDYIETNKLIVEAIFLTHGHFDHNLAVYPVRDATGAPVYIHRADATTPNARNQFKLTADETVRYYGEGDTVTVGSLTFTVLETPGHSPAPSRSDAKTRSSPGIRSLKTAWAVRISDRATHSV